MYIEWIRRPASSIKLLRLDPPRAVQSCHVIKLSGTLVRALACLAEDSIIASPLILTPVGDRVLLHTRGAVVFEVKYKYTNDHLFHEQFEQDT